MSTLPSYVVRLSRGYPKTHSTFYCEICYEPFIDEFKNMYFPYAAHLEATCSYNDRIYHPLSYCLYVCETCLNTRYMIEAFINDLKRDYKNKAAIFTGKKRLFSLETLCFFALTTKETKTLLHFRKHIVQ
jgi:hypothetical protein